MSTEQLFAIYIKHIIPLTLILTLLTAINHQKHKQTQSAEYHTSPSHVSEVSALAKV
jgi:hypothetical protein